MKLSTEIISVMCECDCLCTNEFNISAEEAEKAWASGGCVMCGDCMDGNGGNA